MPKNVIIYSKQICPFCVRAKELFKSKNIPFTEIKIDKDDALRDEMIEKSGRQTVPQIFIDNEHIGGFDDLKIFYEQGKLNY